MSDKTSVETVMDLLPQLPAPQQREVQDFVEFLLQKSARKIEPQDEQDWTAFSLSSAMRGMEDEEVLYDETDLQETWS